jgi:4-oxalocrotonate tautomerase
MPSIQIRMLEGRTIEQRTKLAKAITDAVLSILNVHRDAVWIEFVDIPKTFLARGGEWFFRRPD